MEKRSFPGQLDEIDALLAEGDRLLAFRAEAVSAWSIGQQLDHSLRVARRSLDVLLASGPGLDRGINWTGRCVLALGWFPRGVGKSPKAALPADAPPHAELVAQLPPLRSAFATLQSDAALLARPDAVLKHPYFGCLSPKQTLEFLVIHTAHHLRIVRDIRRAAR